MLCKNCGMENSEGAVFCKGCGTKLVEEPTPEYIEAERVEGEIVEEIPETKETQENTAVTVPPKQEENASKSKEKKPKKKASPIVFGFVGVAIVLIIGFAGIFNYLGIQSLKNEAKEVSKIIYKISDNVEASESVIREAEAAYGNLQEKARKYVEDYEKLEKSIKELNAIVEERKARALEVDQMISKIQLGNPVDSVPYTQEAITLYNRLDGPTKEYVTKFKTLLEAQDEMLNMDIQVTADNIWKFFDIVFEYGGKKHDFDTYSDGYESYEDKKGKWHTKENVKLDMESYHTVYMDIYPKYENLHCTLNFTVDLHQTYVKKEKVKEFDYQAGKVKYNSATDNGEYTITVDNKKGIINSLLGTDFGLPELNFDVSKVIFTNISGNITYQ